MAGRAMIDDAVIPAGHIKSGRGTKWERTSGRICRALLDETTMVVRVGSGSDRDKGSGGSVEGPYQSARPIHCARMILPGVMVGGGLITAVSRWLVVAMWVYSVETCT